MILAHDRFDLYDKMIFERAVLRAPFKIPNSMPNEACFLYVLSGEYQVSSPDQRQRVRATEGVVMKCGMYFAEWLEHTKDETCEAIAVHFYPEILQKIYTDELDNIAVRSAGRQMVKIKNDDLINNFIHGMRFYFQNPSIVDDALVIMKLKEIIHILLKTDRAASIADMLRSFFSPRVHGLRKVVDTHLYSRLSIEELAKLANLSLSSFKREFRRVFNDSPARYLKQRKLERARQLLEKTDRRINEIAFECGFEDFPHFCRTFARHVGLSPGAYRLQKRTRSA